MRGKASEKLFVKQFIKPSIPGVFPFSLKKGENVWKCFPTFVSHRKYHYARLY